MPVRSLSSSVLRWPDADQVDRAVRHWALAEASARAEVLRIGYFGSYARGDWGVGSDLDLVVLTAHSRVPWERRSAAWDTTGLPVPADVLVYTQDEWDRMTAAPGFLQQVAREVVWVYTRDPAAAARCVPELEGTLLEDPEPHP